MLLEVIKRIGIFIIVSQMILHFGIGRKYETYMKLVVSIMVVAQMIFSFGFYVEQNEEEGFIMSEEEYYESWNENLKRMEESLKKEQKDMKFQIKENVMEENQQQQEMESAARIQIEKIVIQ